MRGFALAAATLAGLLATAPAAAQERGGVPGAFDFYVLALSWSPGFCENRGDRGGRAPRQCQGGRQLGFVVHGLWPQYEQGYPRECGTASLPRNVVEANGELYPDWGLARHEWRTHGTCSGLSPTGYFEAVRAARDAVNIPDPLVDIRQDGQTTPQSVERAFTAVNRGLQPDMMAVTCRRGALAEVRICFNKDLRGFRRCPAVDRDACRFGPIRVPAPL